jgi:hypothetical protein
MVQVPVIADMPELIFGKFGLGLAVRNRTIAPRADRIIRSVPVLSMRKTLSLNSHLDLLREGERPPRLAGIVLWT